jgi:hypothetical protein
MEKGFIKYATVKVLGWKDKAHKKVARTEYGEKVKSYYLDEAPSLNLQAVLSDVSEYYKVSSNPEDYELIVVRAVEADKPNDNGDAFTEDELLRFDEKQGQRVYRTFNLKGHHVNHQSSNPVMARGIILDSHFNRGNDGNFVEILIASDKRKDPLLIRNITSGKLDKFSMGCHCEYTKCSICGHKAFSESQFCEHVRDAKMQEIGGKRVYEECYGVVYDEISSVYDPAMKNCEAIDFIKAEKDVGLEEQIMAQTEDLMAHQASKPDADDSITITGMKPNQTITITNHAKEVKDNMAKKNKGKKAIQLKKKADDDLYDELEKEEQEEMPEIPEKEEVINIEKEEQGLAVEEAPPEMTPEEEMLAQDEEVDVHEEEEVPVEEELAQVDEDIMPDEEAIAQEEDVLPEIEEEDLSAEMTEEDLEEMAQEDYIEDEEMEAEINIPQEDEVLEEIESQDEIMEEEDEMIESQEEEEQELEIQDLQGEDDEEMTDDEFGIKGGLLDLEAERIRKSCWVISDKKGPLYMVRLKSSFPNQHSKFAKRFASREYGEDLMRAILNDGFIKTMNRVNAINVVSEVKMDKGIKRPDLWLAITAQSEETDRKQIRAKYDALLKKGKKKVAKPKRRKAQPADVPTDEETRVDFDESHDEHGVTDDVQPLIPPTTVKKDTEDAKNEMVETDTHHFTGELKPAYENISAEYEKGAWNILDGEKCLFSIKSKNATRRVGEKILYRIASEGLVDTWKKFGAPDLPGSITEDSMNDLDEAAQSDYKDKDDIPDIVGAGELKSDSEQTIDDLGEAHPTDTSEVEAKLKRKALADAEEVLEQEKQAFKTKFVRALKLAAKRANYNLEDNSLKASLWDALTKVGLGEDQTEVAIEESFDSGGEAYVDDIVTRAEELVEFTTPAFAQLEADMGNIKSVVAQDEDDEGEKEEEDEDKEASKIAKQAEEGSLLLKSTVETGKKLTSKIAKAVMRYNTR